MVDVLGRMTYSPRQLLRWISCFCKMEPNADAPRAFEVRRQSRHRQFWRSLIGELAVDVLPQVANDLWNFWSHERDEREQQADLTSVLRATAEDIRQYVSELMAELAGDKPPEFRRAVESYLNSIPASVRRSVRRPSDLEGATIPPYFVVQKPEDVLRLLPVRVVRFKPGLP